MLVDHLDVLQDLCADIVLSGGWNISFQSVTNCDADTSENLLSLQPLDTCSPQDPQHE